MPETRITNKSDAPISCFISNFSNGKDNWVPLEREQSNPWERSFWEIVVFKDSNTQCGKYLNLSKGLNIEFNALDDIRIAS